MSNVIPFQPGQVSSVFAGQQASSDLSAGVQAGFGLIGYRGKVWSIRYRGEERQLMRDDGDGPRNSIEVVILKASTHISKIWYEHGYTEGSNQAPDCFSMNGVVPEPSSRNLQSNACASCVRNQWGSRVTPAGKQGKECQDSKRLAVVPLGDIRNEVFGGPLLLRVPAASLQDLAQFGQAMQKMGYPYYAVGTRISFDANEAFPKFQFNAIRPVTDDEARMIIEMQGDPGVDRIIAESEFGATPAAAPVQPTHQFEQPPAAAQPSPVFQQAPQPTGGTQPSHPQAQAPQPTTSQAPATTPGTTSQTGFGPSTGAVPTNAAPAAAASGATQTGQAQPASTPAPATQQTNGASSAGTAGPATGSGEVATTGFGPMAPSNQETPQPQGSPTPGAQPSDQPRFEGEAQKSDVPAFMGGTSGTSAEAQSNDDFTRSLDEKLAALLPG